jgi:hypothetical protein
MNKSKRSSKARQDTELPTKPPIPPAGKRHRVTGAEVHIPAYEGPAKTDQMPKPKAGSGPGRTKPAFDPASVAKPQRRASTAADFGDQKPRRTRAADKSGGGGVQYIRLRIRVENDSLTVVDSHLVDGPLGQATGFPGTNAYEVTLDNRLLHAGALPDLGMKRSLPNPAGPPEQRGHYFVEMPVYEFMARLPAAEVTPETIKRITVRLYRVKEQAQTRRLGPDPLSSQFAREMRRVAELEGLPESTLPEAIESRGGRTPSL